MVETALSTRKTNSLAILLALSAFEALVSLIAYFANRSEAESAWLLGYSKGRLAIGLVFLLVVFAGWVLLAWVSVWIPYGFTFGIALFNVVIAAFIFGAVMWVKGMINALSGRMSLLPLFGQMANRILL